MAKFLQVANLKNGLATLVATASMLRSDRLRLYQKNERPVLWDPIVTLLSRATSTVTTLSCGNGGAGGYFY
jgi:hypothetical protein